MLKQFMDLKTKRLILKKVKESDIKDFYEYASDENVGGNSNWKPHTSLDESRDILDMFISEDEYLGIHLRENSKMIGILGLHKDPLRELDEDLSRELGYGLNFSYWNNGYMTEACLGIMDYVFNYKDLKILTAYTSVRNERSQRVMGKIGMKKEGIIRFGWSNYKGEIYDKYMASITREEYLSSTINN